MRFFVFLGVLPLLISLVSLFPPVAARPQFFGRDQELFIDVPEATAPSTMVLAVGRVHEFAPTGTSRPEAIEVPVPETPKKSEQGFNRVLETVNTPQTSDNGLEAPGLVYGDPRFNFVEEVYQHAQETSTDVPAAAEETVHSPDGAHVSHDPDGYLHDWARDVLGIVDPERRFTYVQETGVYIPESTERPAPSVSIPETLSLTEYTTVSVPETLSLLEQIAVSTPETLSPLENTLVSTSGGLKTVNVTVPTLTHEKRKVRTLVLTVHITDGPESARASFGEVQRTKAPDGILTLTPSEYVKVDLEGTKTLTLYTASYSEDSVSGESQPVQTVSIPESLVPSDCEETSEGAVTVMPSNVQAIYRATTAGIVATETPFRSRTRLVEFTLTEPVPYGGLVHSTRNNVAARGPKQTTKPQSPGYVKLVKSVSTSTMTPKLSYRVGYYQPRPVDTTLHHRFIPQTEPPVLSTTPTYTPRPSTVLGSSSLPASPVSVGFITSGVPDEPTSSPQPASSTSISTGSTSWAESGRLLSFPKFAITVHRHRWSPYTTKSSAITESPLSITTSSAATTGMASIELPSYTAQSVSSPQVTDPPITTVLVEIKPSALILKPRSTPMVKSPQMTESLPLHFSWDPTFGITNLELEIDFSMDLSRPSSYFGPDTALITGRPELSTTTGRDPGIGPSVFSASYPIVEPHWSDPYYYEPLTLSSRQVTSASVTLFPCPHRSSLDRLCVLPPTSGILPSGTQLQVRTPSPVEVMTSFTNVTTSLHIDLSFPENGGHIMRIRRPMDSSERYLTFYPSSTMTWDSDWFSTTMQDTNTQKQWTVPADAQNEGLTTASEYHSTTPAASAAALTMNDIVTPFQPWYNGPVATLTTITTRRQEIWASDRVAPITMNTEKSSSSRSVSRYTRRRMPPQPRSFSTTKVNTYTSFLSEFQPNTETELSSSLIKFSTVTLPLLDGSQSTLTVCEPSTTKDPYENMTHVQITPGDMEYIMARQVLEPVNTDLRSGYGNMLPPAVSLPASKPFSLPPSGNAEYNVNNIRLNTATSIVCSESTWAVLIVFMVLFPITFTIVMTELLIRHIWFRGVPEDIKTRLLADKRYRGYERMLGVGVIATVSVLIGVLVACYLRNGICEDIKVYEDIAGVGQRQF
ncbi:hypothetical protein TWF506_004132 [Arthrobotrys conoides]|uniref:Uncharacterized protein n=1 Tax=Arthrobotrys conoides TaxID=74498 RepID=A0AAN8N1K4_9PEZI